MLTSNSGLDIESGRKNEPLIPPATSKPFFWTKTNVYDGEIQFAKIPVWRLVATIILVYSFALAVSCTSYMCTTGGKVILVFTVLAGSIYMLWAIWWDENYLVPPTWTALKFQGFYSPLIIFWLAYNAVLVAVFAMIFILLMIVNYSNLQQLFNNDCNESGRSGF